ncbi:MAG: 1-acyl-sn-glycerol-3-phosphate acyltransferase [Desulfobacteraceae bacterium]|nr:1-acyl-sn-glycerol-3-phosphate acyltransferase [Desulfobacteraceae bacterium]
MASIGKWFASFKSLAAGVPLHHGWFLPKTWGRLQGWVLSALFSRLRIADDQAQVIRSLPADAVVVYVTRQKTTLERLYLHATLNRAGLPVPEIGFFHPVLLWQPLGRLVRILSAHTLYFFRHFRLPDPLADGALVGELDSGRAALVSLLVTNEYYRRYVKASTGPLMVLIGMQRERRRPVLLIPTSVFYGERPLTSLEARFGAVMGANRQPGLPMRVWRMLFSPDRVFTEFLKPVNLQDVLERWDGPGQDRRDLAIRLRHRLLDLMSAHRLSLMGPTLRSIEEIKQHLLTDPAQIAFMNAFARRTDRSVPDVRKEALGYIEQIAARPNPRWLGPGLRAASWLLDKMFDGIAVNPDGLRRLKEAAIRCPLILVPSHKSNMDSLVVSSLMVRHHLPCPHAFAGENLDFWPTGPIIRRFGAFFVRRSFKGKGAKLYARIFSAYIHMLLEQGFNLEVFIEGGRSRSGKLLAPKLGMLSVLVGAAREGACRDLAFVPISLAYEQVPEVASFVEEMRGGEKKPENFLQLLKARKFLQRRHGTIHIHVCNPVFLSELASERGSSLAGLDARTVNRMTRELGQRILSTIDRHTPITSPALVAAVLLNARERVLDERRIREDVDTLKAHLRFWSSPLAQPLATDPANAVTASLNFFARSRLIHRLPGEGSAVPEPEKQMVRSRRRRRVALDFHRNNCVAAFVPAAYTAAAILARESFLFSSGDLQKDIAFLNELFVQEFAKDPRRPLDFSVRKSIKAFIDDDILEPHPSLPDTYGVTSAGFRKLRLFAGFLKPLLESYAVTAGYLAIRTEKDPPSTRKLRSAAAAQLRKGAIECEEALTRFNLENALSFFTPLLRRSDAADLLAFHERRIRYFLQFL